MTDTEREQLRVTVTVTDGDSIQQLIDCVDDVVDAEAVADRSSNSNEYPAAISIDVDEMTPKQWEALELADDLGYYERPRRTDLETLASELSISKSAVSQRLRAAEATLIRALFESTSGRDSTEQ
ncbi:helix-turn-helix domain-containing protein [Natrinema ejinorense]|uniref:Bacterio-opsin activator n=1 Tax=Natrinema ejinorense TaxID=373386 RepID=A0A2A5QU19_9EURY|nr:helix-turn-helix domain-containing protein [Natrinema ejinorense]PCR90341.1 bacterio-opsin activator [Natrinema ejinorense]